MRHLIAEFEEQSFTQIIFPHADTDWIEYLDEAEKTFIEIIKAIIKYQKCLVVCADKAYVSKKFIPNKNLYFVEYKTDDTWARDCSALSIYDNGKTSLLNFTFNAWGEKFEACKDNGMNNNLAKHYSQKMQNLDFILEGGALESNGENILLTTSSCMLDKNRNTELTPIQITQHLNNYFGATDILYLNHGYLAGDDTDSHIDTLARFISKDTIMYIRCDDKNDVHYKELKLMEDELQVFAKEYKLNLIHLPMSDALYFDGERLPATYANFLFVNGAILVPTYGVKQDKEALNIFTKIFKNKDIIEINCETLIKQHGSLHCVTMNFASGINLLV